MDHQVMKSLRLPRSLVDEAERHARGLGLTFADIVEAGLRREVGMKPNVRTELLKDLALLVSGLYPSKKGFPPDVTLVVVRQMRDDKALKSAYDEAIRDEDGQIDDGARAILHRQIGLLVKRVLDAKVIGRSNPLDPVVELIKTHALLVPSV